MAKLFKIKCMFCFIWLQHLFRFIAHKTTPYEFSSMQTGKELQKDKRNMDTMVKLFNQRWWIPVFRKNSNMTGDMYTCVSVTENFLRVHTHITSFFKVPYHKSVKQKNDLVLWSLPAVRLIYSSSVEHWHGPTGRSESRAWHWWIPTERCRICISRWWIPITGGGSESWGGGAEIRRDPQFNPCMDKWFDWTHCMKRSTASVLFFCVVQENKDDVMHL